MMKNKCMNMSYVCDKSCYVNSCFHFDVDDIFVNVFYYLQ